MERLSHESASSTERKRSVEEIVGDVIAVIRKRVAARFAGEPYHNFGHSFETVLDGSEQVMDLAERAGVANRDEEARLAQRLAAMAHDMIIRRSINMTPGTPGASQMLRWRGFGDMMPESVSDTLRSERWRKGNEEASWLELEHVMDEADPDGIVFTPHVRALARDAIAVTYPNANFEEFPSEDDLIIKDYDPATGTPRGTLNLAEFLRNKQGRPAGLKFFQPNLTPESEIPVVAVALGDLSEGGRVSSAEFFDKGNAEYWETRPLTRREFENGFADLPEPPPSVPAQWRRSVMAEAASDMLNWARTQVGFLLWQKLRYHEILETNVQINRDPRAAARFKAGMNAVYAHFDANIAASYRRAQDLEQRFGALRDAETFSRDSEAEKRLYELAGAMGYRTLPAPMRLAA